MIKYIRFEETDAGASLLYADDWIATQRGCHEMPQLVLKIFIAAFTETNKKIKRYRSKRLAGII